uniref:Uncharacterized protein n=1 Tax=Anguilla anguilla TaxID=7936 RepID=A0A0E9PYY0_ANGAN
MRFTITDFVVVLFTCIVLFYKMLSI